MAPRAAFLVLSVALLASLGACQDPLINSILPGLFVKSADEQSSSGYGIYSAAANNMDDVVSTESNNNPMQPAPVVEVDSAHMPTATNTRGLLQYGEACIENANCNGLLAAEAPVIPLRKLQDEWAAVQNTGRNYPVPRCVPGPCPDLATAKPPRQLQSEAAAVEAAPAAAVEAAQSKHGRRLLL